MWFKPHTGGRTPDYRFSLANERTFLAWIRTALALVGGGLAVAQLLPGRPRIPIAIALFLLGAACGIRAVNHWARCERAMRHDEDLPPSRFPALLALAIAVGAVGLIAITLLGRFGR